MVTGPGRSGTSTMAGALVSLGFSVPGEPLTPNSTNPRGFFEPRWAVGFHKGLLQDCGVGTLDTLPGARERVARVAERPEVRRELRSWLEARFAEEPRLVVKDPRLSWFVELWTDVARDLGVEPGHVVMLRHPVEVAGSRERHYRDSEDGAARGVQIGNVAGWLNVLLQTERATAGSSRAFVRYPDLVADWRSQLTRVEHHLGLGLGDALATSPNPVDELIDPSLRRVHAEGWDDADVPAWLRDLGQRVWVAFGRLADDEPEVAVADEIAALRAEYRDQVQDARALTRRARERAELRGYRRGLREAEEALRERPSPLARLFRRRAAR
jgi:hypothetical protein